MLTGTAVVAWSMSSFDAGRAAASSEDVVRWSSTWVEGGEVATEGALADCDDGPPCRVPGLIEPTDAQGRPYGFQMGARQSAPGDSVERWARVERAHIEPVSLEERVQRYESRRGEVADALIDHRLSLVHGGSIQEPSGPALSEEVAAWLEGPGPDRMEVLVGLSTRPSWRVSTELRRELATGLVDDAHHKARQRTLTTSYRDEQLALQEPVVTEIEAHGGIVHERFWLTSVLRLEADRSLVGRLLQREDVSRIFEVSDIEVRPGYDDSIDGLDSAQGIGIEPYHLDGYEGSEPNPAQHGFGRVTVGVIDTPFQSNTLAFLSHGSWSLQCPWGQPCGWVWTGHSGRLKEIWDCRNNPCTNPSSMNALPSPPATIRDRTHGTLVAAIAAGDVTRSQDPNLSHPLWSPYSAEDRARRSGIARQSGLVLLAALPDASGGHLGLVRAIEKAAERAVDVVNMSVWFPNLPCASPNTAALDVALAIKELSRSKIALFVGITGNAGHSGTLCTVRPPGDGPYVFTAGGTTNAENPTVTDCVVEDEPGTDCSIADADCVRSAAINVRSGRGGTPYLSGVRSLVNSVAPGMMDRVADPDGDYSCAGGDEGGTSVAAPQIAGAAAVLKGAWIDQSYPAAMYNDPHLLFATLMLMGDRQAASGGLLPSGFDSLFGNGRFDMRKLDADGMQAPWGWETGTRWITSTHQFVALNGGAPLPSGVSEIRATLWWPEPFVTNGGSNGADIGLSLQSTTSSGGVCGWLWTNVRSDTSSDTHKMVRAVAQANRCYRLRITPYVVTNNPWENNDAVRDVHWAYYYD